MIKFLLILLIGLCFESAGVVCLKKGMSSMGQTTATTPTAIAHLVTAGARNPQILLGVFFEALFFVSLLVLMAKCDISFLWPLTALSFVFATFAAIWFLDERVSAIRWAGVMLIMLGAAFISYSEHAKGKAPTQNGGTPVQSAVVPR
jgi:uncharacterized membrane protein